MNIQFESRRHCGPVAGPPVVKGSRVALGLFLHTYGRATEQSRFCQRPDDSVLIAAQFSSSAFLGCSDVTRGGEKTKKSQENKVKGGDSGGRL